MDSNPSTMLENLQHELRLTKQTIQQQLDQVNKDEPINPRHKSELEWDLWTVKGLLDHGLSINNLQAAKTHMQSKGEKPIHYSYV